MRKSQQIPQPNQLNYKPTNSGIAVIGIRYAINAPILPPILKILKHK